MVIIDSDVLLLAFAFPNDDRQKLNQKFLELAQTAQPATTIYNLMEVLGQLSFNLSEEQLDQWQDWLVNALILSSAERTPDVEFFVTWNAKHFKGKTDLAVLTPEEYLNR